MVPPATVRYGAHVEPGANLMPSYVNIGAVGAGTMVDTGHGGLVRKRSGETCTAGGSIGAS